jgi:hypothetical protein
VDLALAYAEEGLGTDELRQVLAAEVRALRAERAALDERAASAVDVSSRQWAAHAVDLRYQRDEARAEREDARSELRGAYRVQEHLVGEIRRTVGDALGGDRTRETWPELLAALAAVLERLRGRDDLGRRAAQLWADAWKHRHDATDDEQAQRAARLEAAMDAIAAAHGIEVQR